MTPPALPAAATPRTWDLFCRLLDNFGDVGVNWRLAADLASRGDRVRLWIDDAAPLRFMAPQGAPGVDVRPWPADDQPFAGAPPGEVVIETFGCELPTPVIEAMRATASPPVWLNLEYLSAEDFVERSHGLPSPQRNGLPKWFCFPGFTPATGGLLREPGLLERRARFDRDGWLAGHGLARRPGERVALLFCYPNPGLPALLQALGEQPTLLLLTPGHAQQQVRACAEALPPTLRLADLPWLTQAEFDHALWSTDLNLIRGEDTWVRAIWAGVPFLWHLYPQEAEYRELKLAAWLRRMCGGSGPLHDALLRLHRRYNALDGQPPQTPPVLPDLPAWGAQLRAWRDTLAAQDDLVSQLRRFVAAKS